MNIHQFDVNYQYSLYLQRGGLTEQQMTPIQRQELKRAFFGAVGQMLSILVADLPTLRDDVAERAVLKMQNQVADFWNKEVARHEAMGFAQPTGPVSQKGDFTQMCKDVAQVMQNALHLKERPGIAIAFTCEPDFDTAHWVTNLPRPDAVNLFRSTAQRLIANSN